MPLTKPYQPSRNQRLDRELYALAGNVCFITVRAYANQTPFTQRPLNQMVLDALRQEATTQRCALYTYCLMPNHLHFLAGPEVDGASV